MELFGFIFKNTILALLSCVSLCFLLRAVLSLFGASEDNRVLLFAAYVTEPVIWPFRALFDRLGLFEESPIDVPFLCGVFVLMLTQAVLSLF